MNTVTTSLDADGLYARHGKPLEQSHQGEYIAISQDGQVIVGADDVAVIDQAVQHFGSGNFIFRRIGYSYVDKLRWGDAGQPGLSILCLASLSLIPGFRSAASGLRRSSGVLG